MEHRICDSCGHEGDDGGSDTHSFCTACQETVPTPQEDKCPACNEVGHMTIACPECGGRYAAD